MMGRHAARWAVLFVAFIIAVFIYGLWKQIEIELVGYSLVSSIMRGIVVFGFMFFVWNITKKMIR